MTVDPDARPDDGRDPLIHDPCCGSGLMLEEAAKINPHAELVGVDIDATCANMAAINLGLRSRYGWIVCANSLSGESRFAYRIGSFYHEGPNGRRRGVIRDVPPEKTPVPVLSARLRRQSADLLDQQIVTDEPTEVTIPTIMEVPQWLARLEPQLAALEAGDENIAEAAVSATEESDAVKSTETADGQATDSRPPPRSGGTSEQLDLF